MILINQIKKFIFMGLIGVPLFSNAGDFKISNYTKKDITFSIRHYCSDKFGVIKAHKTKIISETDFAKACEYSPHHCSATLFHSDNCVGESVATVTLDVSFGLKEIELPTNYAFTWRYFYLIISDKK